MNQANIVFECARCGECCKSIRGGMFGQVQGLMLFHDERGLFSRKLIKPQFRYMEDYRKLPSFVWMYQVDADRCPQYDDEKGCLIYENRPQTCRAFPFEPKGKGLAIHAKCLEIRRLMKEGPMSRVKVPRGYRPSILAIHKYFTKWLVTKKIERFDLERNEWRHMLDGISEEDKKRMGWK